MSIGWCVCVRDIMIVTKQRPMWVCPTNTPVCIAHFIYLAALVKQPRTSCTFHNVHISLNKQCKQNATVMIHKVRYAFYVMKRSTIAKIIKQKQ